MFTIKRVLLLPLILTSSLLLTSFTAMAANIPEKLLTLPITLINGDVVTLEQYRGKKPVYLKFWATWCQPCRKQMPHFEQIQQKFSNELEVIAINLGVNDDLAAVLQTQKEFNLTMPMAIDKSGDLAQAFRLLGTPYHLLFDQQMNLVHIGHESDEVLDNKIALITQNSPLDRLNENILLNDQKLEKLAIDNTSTYALFFTATWCDWYFKDSRPLISQQCSTGQKNINQLSKEFTKLNWQGVISRLWTGSTELDNYTEKYNITYPLLLDATNEAFHQYQIKQLPTLIIIKNGEVVFKTSDLLNIENLSTTIQTLSL